MGSESVIAVSAEGEKEEAAVAGSETETLLDSAAGSLAVGTAVSYVSIPSLETLVTTGDGSAWEFFCGAAGLTRRAELCLPVVQGGRAMKASNSRTGLLVSLQQAVMED